MTNSTSPTSAERTTPLQLALRLLLVLGILAVAAGISYYWLTTRPVTKREPQAQLETLVEVVTLLPTRERVVVRAMGTVLPARSIQLAAQVGGSVIEISPNLVPGGQFKSGDVALRLDPADYDLAVRQRQGELAKAESSLKIEQGQQAVARQEYALLGQEIQEEDKELVLRDPQRVSAEAVVAVAQAALDGARLDLARTAVMVPFNAMVESRNVDVGAQVAAGMTVATLVGTDEFWVQVSVPVDQLHWIALPDGAGEGGALAELSAPTAWGPGATRPGTVIRLLAGLEPQGRMARLLVAVKNPLDLAATAAARRPLLLDSYVRVAIQGREQDAVFKIPRGALRDGNQLWIMQADGTLAIRPITILWGDDNFVYIGTGLAAGEKLVTSDLPTPVPGLKMRVAPAVQAAPAPTEAAP